MSDYSNKELLEAIYDVRDRVTRIEEGLKRTEKLEDKIVYAHDKALTAKDIAEEALSISKTNMESIGGIKTTNRWAWGLFIAALGEIIAQHFGFSIK